MAIQKSQVTRQILLAEMTKGICKITFIKRDGSVRIAFSTLNSLLIPAQFEESIKKIFLEDANPDIIPFWDVAQGKWKSFYINSVENLVTAEELNKNSPGLQKNQENDLDNKQNADEIQDVDDNEDKKITSMQKKANSAVDSNLKEMEVDPINRQNTKKKGHLRNTKTNITQEKEKKMKNIENARNILNKLRAEAQSKFRRN